MSADDRHVLGVRLPGVRVLEHPLVGFAWHRTAIAVGYLIVLLALFAVSHVGTTVTVDGRAVETLSPQFDAISAIVIALATGTVTILPVVYAIWNGGPALAFALAASPVLLGSLATGQYVFGVDAAIALTVGAAASALAVVAADVRRTGSVRPWRVRRESTASVQLLFATMVTAVVGAGILRFVATVPPRYLEWYRPFAGAWLVPAVVLGVYWATILRSSGSIDAGSERPES